MHHVENIFVYGIYYTLTWIVIKVQLNNYLFKKYLLIENNIFKAYKCCMLS